MKNDDKIQKKREKRKKYNKIANISILFIFIELFFFFKMEFIHLPSITSEMFIRLLQLIDLCLLMAHYLVHY